MWRELKLSLERPYKDDSGQTIPDLLDITAEGHHVYETKDDPSKSLGEKLRRMFTERGFDFFEKADDLLDGRESEGEGRQDTDDASEKDSAQMMTTDELFRMRMEILPQLYVALGEITHAKELLTMLLATETSPDPLLSAVIVSKPPPIPSLQAFNAQLQVGGKDEALRKASDIFRSAAESMERGRSMSDKYWMNALKIRKANWGLIPAPLPFGTALGKGADRTSKDFLISFALEEAPASFKRSAIGYMSNTDTTSESLVFPNRQHTRLRVSISVTASNGLISTSHNTSQEPDKESLDGLLTTAQQEIVEQEIFSILVKEGSGLPTASARVSERLIVIDAAEGLELRFELVINNEITDRETRNDAGTLKCDLIFHFLHVLLLRLHSHTKNARLGSASLGRPPGQSNQAPLPPVLQPVIDMLQYQVFCDRVRRELTKAVSSLLLVGIQASLRFDAIGELGEELLKVFEQDFTKKLGGEAVLRLIERQTLRLTFTAPSSLVAHLPRATLVISSIPQLVQLLSDEIERCLLQRFCELGSQVCEGSGATWFVDHISSCCVARWEGCVLNFRIQFGEDFTVGCSAFFMDRKNSPNGTIVENFPVKGIALMKWIEGVVRKASIK